MIGFNRFFSLPLIIGLLVLTLAETALRFAGFGAPLIYRVSKSGYEVAPNQKVNRVGKMLTYNADGFRVNDVMAAYKEIRIITLGDSITNGGSYVSDVDTYPLKLEAKLKARGIQASVLNPSAAGWSLLNEAEWLEAHGTWGAKLLYLQVGENDLFQTFSGADTLDKHPSFPSRKPISATVEVINRYLLPRLSLGVKGIDPGAVASKADMNALRASIGAVADVAKIARKNGAEIVIVYIQPRVPSKMTETIKAKEVFLAASREMGLSILDTSPSMVTADVKTLFRDNLHPNAKGNEVLATVVAADAERRLKMQ